MNRKSKSHKVVKEIGVAIMIATGLHVLLSHQVIVRMVLLPFQLFVFPLLLLFPGFLFFSVFALLSPFYFHVFFLLGAKVGELLDAGLVESIDDRIFSFLDEDLTDLLRIVERYLTAFHGSVFKEVRPWCINDGDVILFISCSVHSS